MVGDLGALCEMDELDVVDLCTPPYLHATQTLQVLAAGKHVICEKPLAGSLEDADRVIAAEQAIGSAGDAHLPVPLRPWHPEAPPASSAAASRAGRT